MVPQRHKELPLVDPSFDVIEEITRFLPDELSFAELRLPQSVRPRNY
jgi:hypothetical protein